MKKLRFYKLVLIEILETLCSICLYLEVDSRITHNKNGVFMGSHFETLKTYSEKLRG